MQKEEKSRGEKEFRNRSAQLFCELAGNMTGRALVALSVDDNDFHGDGPFYLISAFIITWGGLKRQAGLFAVYFGVSMHTGKTRAIPPQSVGGKFYTKFTQLVYKRQYNIQKWT